MREERAFTILESLVALAVLAVLATVTIPTGVRAFASFWLRSAAWRLAADLQRTRQQALAANQSWRLTLSTTDVDASGAARSYVMGPSIGGAGDTRSFAPGVFCLEPPGSTVEFNSRGLVAAPSKLTVANSSGGRVPVLVHSTGRIDFQ